MKLYRVTFTTSLLVEAPDEYLAERIGHSNLSEEVRNGMSEVWSTDILGAESELRREEQGSLPWRHSSRHGEPEETVNEILRRTEAETPKVPSPVCPGCCYSDGRENRDDGTWTCWRCGDSGENE